VALPITAILDRQIDFDPAGDFETFARAVPAKWVVYLLADATGQPVQLLCVKNLRHSLKRRLGGDEQDVGPSRRVNYRELVRQIYYKRVDSAFEADCVYYEAARLCFPQTYSAMVGFRPAWFVHVDPDAEFPRFTKTTDLTPRPGRLIGPVEDKHAAQHLIELAEDSFDLCRYYNVLTEAPRGKACAYKEMGRCPAPCDGSIGMNSYRRMVQWAADTLIDPSTELAHHTKRMQSAAMELKFETAGKIKSLIDALSKLGKGPFRHVQLLSDFAYVSLQRGPSRGDVNVFLITPGQIEPLLCLTDLPERSSDALRFLLHTATERTLPPDTSGAERIGIAAHHLFSAKATQGIFLPLREVNEKSFLKAYRDVLKQKIAAESDDDEGVMKELQAI
jgi:excinuclease UvrABC nuclease subunit